MAARPHRPGPEPGLGVLLDTPSSSSVSSGSMDLGPAGCFLLWAYLQTLGHPSFPETFSPGLTATSSPVTLYPRGWAWPGRPATSSPLLAHPTSASFSMHTSGSSDPALLVLPLPYRVPAPPRSPLYWIPDLPLSSLLCEPLRAHQVLHLCWATSDRRPRCPHCPGDATALPSPPSLCSVTIPVS